MAFFAAKCGANWHSSWVNRFSLSLNLLTQLSLLAPSGDDFGGVKAQESESHQRGALATRL
jgi:hypothetical protein